ncbi:MAG: beta-ketoacyl synthase chain length factor [SAR324 cluster bacterium]|nr:beta-ketoacyl synthase chain length factor [SAR324 cluster bacterium]
MNPVFINSVGLAAPGLMGWGEALPVLLSEQGYRPAGMPKLVPAMLPSNERRRATRTIRLALQACQEAMEKSPYRAEKVSSVFTSSDGDTELLDSLCTALAKENPVLSPFEFHNSVHNAPAGYWAIATGSHSASTSLCGFDGSFSCGLIDAVAQVAVESTPVMMVAYDQPLPPPLDAKRPLVAPFAAAFLIGPQPGEGDLAQARLRISTAPEEEDVLHDPELERLRLGNPAARGLPLLMALARKTQGGNSQDGNSQERVTLPYQNGSRLIVELAPC